MKLSATSRKALQRSGLSSAPGRPERRITPAYVVGVMERSSEFLDDLRRKALRSRNTRLNLVLFPLATCCGLRASEIAQLQVGDVRWSWRVCTCGFGVASRLNEGPRTQWAGGRSGQYSTNAMQVLPASVAKGIVDVGGVPHAGLRRSVET